ncbi:MAG: tetratricopeptide repeat protein [Acidobacteria bacterium]|nr:tetratricopeptide repeat protein [Acidobacteriota bacterium]
MTNRGKYGLVKIAVLSTTLLSFAIFSVRVLQAQRGQVESTGRLLQGQVRVSGGSVPPRGVEVRLELHSMLVDRTRSDSSGRFLFSGLGANTYTLVVDEPEFQAVHETVTIQTLSGGPVQVVITLQPLAAGTASGEAAPVDQAAASLAELLESIPAKARKEFEEGVKAGQEAKPDKAIQHYKKVIEADPAFYPAYNNLGYQYLSKGNLPEAEKAFTEAIKLHESDASPYIGLGNVLFQGERLPEAERVLRQGLERDPNVAFGHYLLGAVLFRGRSLPQAEGELRAALKYDPNLALAQMTLIDLYLQQQRDREAHAELKVFVERFPKHPMLPQAKQMLQQMEEWLRSQPQP